MFPRLYNMYPQCLIHSYNFSLPLLPSVPVSCGPGCPSSLSQGALLRATWTWPILPPCNSGYQVPLPAETFPWIEKYKFENIVDILRYFYPEVERILEKKRTKIPFTAMMSKNNLSILDMHSKAAASNFLEVIGWMPSDLGDLPEFNSSNKFWVGAVLSCDLFFPSFQSGDWHLSWNLPVLDCPHDGFLSQLKSLRNSLVKQNPQQNQETNRSLVVGFILDVPPCLLGFLTHFWACFSCGFLSLTCLPGLLVLIHLMLKLSLCSFLSVRERPVSLITQQLVVSISILL